MKLALLLLLLVAATLHARAQGQPDQPPGKDQVPDLHLGDWNKNMPPVAIKPGITVYFDYTKFLEWLIPRKHAKIPFDCDPTNIHDTIPPPPAVKRDSTSKGPPV